MTTDEALLRIQSHVRPVSVAQIGGFRPTENPLTSWFGGNFVGLLGEQWPMGATEPMVPLIQVRTDELPYCPPQLAGIALLNVFWEYGKVFTPLDNGDGWIIRTYQTLEGLFPLPMPDSKKRWPKTLTIHWSLEPEDNPGWENAWICNSEAMEVINADEDATSEFEDLPRSYRTKVGGWPTFIQGAKLSGQDFVLQIASEEKPNWMLVDNGIIYIFCTPEGHWQMHLDFC